MAEAVSAILEKKQLLEEDLRRVEKQIYQLEGEYLQDTVKDGNIIRGWDSYLGNTSASSGAIRRINRFREADRMFSASSVTSGQASTFNAAQASQKEGAGGGGGGGKVKDSKKSSSSGHRKRARDDGGD